MNVVYVLYFSHFLILKRFKQMLILYMHNLQIITDYSIVTEPTIYIYIYIYIHGK